MSTYIRYEVLLFLQSVAMGALLLLCYGILAAFRRVVPHHPAVSAAEDLLYWLAVGLVVFAGIYETNQGILRSFLFLGILLGVLLCRAIFYPLFVTACEVVLGIPVGIGKKTINGLLFLVRRCKILVSHLANHPKKRQKEKHCRTKRGRKFGKIRKTEQKKKNRI